MERERERERERKKESERKRERERQRETDRQTNTDTDAFRLKTNLFLCFSTIFLVVNTRSVATTRMQFAVLPLSFKVHLCE